jgi:hypothetical protein
MTESTRAQLLAKGFSEDDIRRHEEAEIDTAAAIGRQRDANDLVFPIVHAALLDRRFFTALEPEVRALVTLWTLSVQIHRNGLFYFVEDDPTWIVDDVPVAARTLDQPALAAAFERLLPQLRSGRSRSRYSARSVDFGEHEEIGRIVTRYEHGRGFEDALVDLVLARASVLEPLRTRADAVVEKRLGPARRAKEAKQSAARTRWDALRETARPWTASARFEVDESLLHPKLGLGHVRTSTDTKIVVDFEDGETRALVHGR